MRAAKAMFQRWQARVEAARLVELLFHRHHAPHLVRHRLEAIVARVRLVAAAFSVMTLVWIVLDMATLERGQWLTLAAFRVLAVVAFARLAMIEDGARSRSVALGMLGAMLAIPMVLFCIAQIILAGSHLEGLAAINGRLYESLPFIVLAGLCIFPLVMAEGVFFAIFLLAFVGGIDVATTGFDLVRLSSTLWVLCLVLGIYMLASAIQLHYMMALLRRASHDPLTGALTRRSGAETINLHFRLACERDAPFALAFLDIDDFKSLNDSHGHEIGDQALCDAVHKLGNALRQADVVVRWGGEEFVVIMPNTGLEGVAVAVARVMEEWLGARPDGAPLTASIGVSERIADGVDDWALMIQQADERMYEAKRSGKARCLIAPGRMLLPHPSQGPDPGIEGETGRRGTTTRRLMAGREADEHERGAKDGEGQAGKLV